MNICVENLSDETTEDDLRYAFAAFGQVRFVNIVRDGVAGESRVFGFVGMPSTNEAQTAIFHLLLIVFEVPHPLGPVALLDEACPCPRSSCVASRMPLQGPQLLDSDLSC